MAEKKIDKFWKEESSKEKESVVEKSKPQINIGGEKIRNGIGQLILTVVELLRELMEKQAIRRIDAGKLTEEQIENLGNTFRNLKEEIEKLKDYFDLEDEDLNINLGPLVVREDETGEKVSAIELLDRLLRKGVLVKGDVIISVAEVDLISLNLGLLLANIDKAKELYGG
jgi:hypothetical protein